MLSHSIDECLSTRERIVHAAATAFSANGFRASTMSSIAYSARVNTITVYRYFPKKQQLYWEAIDFRLRSSGIMEFLLDTSETPSDPRELFRELFAIVIEALNQDPGLPRLLYFAALELEQERSILLKTHFQPVIQNLKNRLEARVGDGAAQSPNIDCAVNTFLRIFFGHSSLYGIFGLKAQGPHDDEQLALEYANFCVAGLEAGLQH